MAKTEKNEWTRYHDILYLYMAMVIADGEMNVVEREVLFVCMRGWQPDLEFRDYINMVRIVSKRMRRPENSVELLKSLEKCTANLAKRMASKPKLSMKLMEHLRKVAQVDGGFAPSTFDHASTGFPLSGQHEELSCQDCHAEKVDGFPK